MSLQDVLDQHLLVLRQLLRQPARTLRLVLPLLVPVVAHSCQQVRGQTGNTVPDGKVVNLALTFLTTHYTHKQTLADHKRSQQSHQTII